MDNTLIIILAIVLLILFVLNNVTIIKNQNNIQASCSQTAFGCCPDGVNSKINYYGTNCPGYKLMPGYPIPPPPPPPPPPTTTQPPTTQPPITPQPITPPQPKKPIGGCSGTIYGCCPNNYTPKLDQSGSNCILKT